MDDEIRKWLAEEMYMQNLSTAYIPRKTHVFGIDPPSDDLGYTLISKSDTAEIFVARMHEYMRVLDGDERSLLRLGIYTHEALHQIFTDFDETTQLMKLLSGGKKVLFKEIANIVEDTRIEYFADQKFGGEALAALRFTIKTIYKSSDGIGNESDPVSQVLNALIYLGDLGIVKGEFTFPEAFECFKEIVPHFEMAVTEPICSKALKISLKITDIIAKLFPDLPDDLDTMKRSSKLQGKGHGTDASEKKDKSGGRKSSRISKELLDMLGIKLGDSDDDVSESKKTSSDDSDDFELDEDDDFEGTISDFGEFDDSKEASEGSVSAKKSERDKKEKDALSDINEKLKELSEKEEESKTTDEEESLDEALKKLAEIVETMSTVIDKQSAKERSDDEKIPNVDLPNDPFASKIINTRMAPNDKYAALVEKNIGLINATKNYLKRILLNEADEKERHTSGEVNLGRYFDKSYTSVRIFDKRRNNDNGNICVMILADESGSTDGPKSVAIKNATVVLAEVCAAFDIPCCVLGFSADETESGSVDIRHYTTWKNKRTDRTSIASMTARYENRDGATIRYATSLLKKRNEATKLMFILSDGLPCAHYYHGDAANYDTQLAIREAKKEGSVTGILVGATSVEEIHKMYGNDFLLVKTVSQLPAQLAKAFRKAF